MAIVRRIESRQLESEARHTETECTYSVGEDSNGERYLQIDTYGSLQRKMPGKKSQSIRFAPSAIRELKTILQEHFGN
jgi:hypothetical protein